ncbi:hypothetical protein ACOSQ4_006476 [Xanthoceras sorbifolium]
MAAQQLQVLKALDVAKTQWYHFTAVVIAGMGFCMDSYDLFCIHLVTKLLGRIYYHKEGSYTPGYLPNSVAAAVIGVALCGTIAGQLFFGWLGGKMGRKCIYSMTLMLVAVCSIASDLSFGKDPKVVMSTLCFFRFWLGFGIGGDYPLSATIMSKHASKKTRGAFISAVFAMYGFKILAGGMVAIIASAAFNAKFSAPICAIDCNRSTVPEADYFDLTKLPETVRYTTLVAKNAPQATSDMVKVLQVDLEAKQFLLDIAFYTQNLFQEDIFSAIGWLPKAENSNAIEEVYRTARAQIVIALCNTVLDYWFTVALIDKIDKMGRFAIQLMGFFFMTIFMFALAIPYNYWTISSDQIGFVVMYSLTFFFSNFGPNTTTFVVSAEIFSARLRSTCHGISAAACKAGAMVGALGFSAAMHAIGLRKVFIVLGVVKFLGMMFTFLVPESQGKSLEEMSGEADVETADAENGTST